MVPGTRAGVPVTLTQHPLFTRYAHGNEQPLPFAHPVHLPRHGGSPVGYFFPDVAVELRPLSTILVQELIDCLIAPLIFSTLVVGITSATSAGGRMGIKALVYFEIVTTLPSWWGWWR